MNDELTSTAPNGPTPVDRSKIRAWQVCEEDIVAAETWEEAIAYHVREMGSDREDLDDEPNEVPLTKSMRREAWDGESQRITLRQAIAEAAHFPCLLCSTEF
jgi:hypothetical protein